VDVVKVLLTLSLLLLTACLAPDGATYTIATVDADNRLQVQTIDINAEEEFYRGVWTMCLLVSAAHSGNDTGDLAACDDVTATAYLHDGYRDSQLLDFWNWELVTK
jgi:hypothetical protein